MHLRPRGTVARFGGSHQARGHRRTRPENALFAFCEPLLWHALISRGVIIIFGCEICQLAIIVLREKPAYG